MHQFHINTLSPNNAVREMLEQGVIWLAACPTPVSDAPLPPTSGLNAGFGLPEIDESAPLPFGGMHEFFSGGSDHLLPFEPCSIPALLAANAAKRALAADLGRAGPLAAYGDRFNRFLVWIGRRCWPAPFILEGLLSVEREEGAERLNLLHRCLFIDPPESRLTWWCLEILLRSPAAAVITAAADRCSFALSRKFALLAKRRSAFIVLIRPPHEMAVASAALSRWRVAPLPPENNPAPALSPSPRWRLNLVKYRGRQPSKREWFLEQQEEAIPGSSYAKISLRIPAVVDGGPGGQTAGGEGGAGTPPPAPVYGEISARTGG